MRGMSLDYRSRDDSPVDWHNLAALTMMGSGAVANVAISLWAIYVPKVSVFWMFPLLGSFGVLVGGVVWWMLNRRGLS